MSLIGRIRLNPTSYLKRAANPFWWSERHKRLQRQRADILECDETRHLLHEMQNGDIKDVTSYRDQRLLRILEYAGNHCKYYKNTFRDVGFNTESLNNFSNIPLLDKKAIRFHRTDLMSDEIGKMDVREMNTGGSTGEPLEFLVCKTAGLVDRVHQEFVFRTTMQYKSGDVIVAFGGSSVPCELLDAGIFWIGTSKDDLPFGRLTYSSLYLSSENIARYIKHLFSMSPAILRGYPSILNDLAEYILKKEILVPFRIKGIQLTAENAHSWQIENIRKAFCTKVFLQYGHSEVSVLGYTFDETYEYYCSPFYGFTEVLDRNGKPVNPGEVGEVVVTGFNNFAMPFIRYQTGDMALFNSDVDGIVRLGKILGRTQDYVVTKNGERISLTALIFGQHYRTFKNIQKWQLQQDFPGKVTVRIVKGQGFSTKNEMEIREKFREICDVQTDFEYVDHIPLASRGKFQFLVQNICM